MLFLVVIKTALWDRYYDGSYFTDEEGLNKGPKIILLTSGRAWIWSQISLSQMFILLIKTSCIIWKAQYKMKIWGGSIQKVLIITGPCVTEQVVYPWAGSALNHELSITSLHQVLPLRYLNQIQQTFCPIHSATVRSPVWIPERHRSSLETFISQLILLRA